MYAAGLVAALIAAIWLAPIAAQGDDASPAGHSQAGRRPGGRGQFGPLPGGGLALERLGRELAFTDAQNTQIQALLTAQRTALRSALEGLRQAQRQLDTAIMQVPEDDGLIQSQVAAVAAAQSVIAVAHAETEARIYQLLTADQQQKAQQRLAQAQRR
jgi:Spy/CpxP family protein refolding chaperone